MNNEIIFPSLLIISGILVATIVIISLTRVSKKIVKFFQLYPESKGILTLSLKLISWFVGLIVFLIFLRLALRMWGLEFTTQFIEEIIRKSPKYIIAILIILTGFYVSRIVRERSKDYHFEFKGKILLLIDFIIHTTFIFTALYSVGIEITFFIEFYKAILWVVGGIFALVVSMVIGIPLGISVYEKTKMKKKYLLPTKRDIEILDKCKKLEKLSLSKEDRFLVKFIKTQLKDDWRKPLLKKLNQLLKKYR